MLKPHTIKRSDMVTEAFSGARAPITHTGDHVSGLFRNCHVVPQSVFNLLAIGPHLDVNPNYAVVMSARLALQLVNVDFTAVADAPDPRRELVKQLQSVDEDGHHLVTISTIGTRTGPGALYRTDLFDMPAMPNARTKLVNSAITGKPLPNIKIPSSVMSYIHKPVAKSVQQPALPTTSPTTDTVPEWTTSTATERALLQLQELHCALGHPSNDVLSRALRDSSDKHHQRLRKYIKLMDKCNICPAGNQREEPHLPIATTRVSSYFARLILDCSGRQAIASLGGAWYSLLIVDDYSRMKWVRLLQSITQVSSVFDDFLRTVVRQGTATPAGKVRCVQLVRTDNGPDFNCDKFRQVLRHHSITHEPSPPDASAQRGLAERGIGVLSKIFRAGLVWAKAPIPFWGEAVKHSAPTSNNSPNSANPDNKSPYQMVNPGRPSQLHKMKPFGCLAFTLVKVKDRQGKLNPASSCGFFAGYGLTPDGSINGYRVMNFRTQRFTTKYNVRCNERLPALRYILSALVNSPQQLLVGRTVRKKFEQGTFTGTIVAHSTQDNATFYHVRYTDGDEEQMDLLEVLQHITPVQEDMSIHRPNMHRRLQQSTATDRARIGTDLLVAPTVSRPAVSSTVPHQSKRSPVQPNRLTFSSFGGPSNSSTLPVPLTTHTANKANVAAIHLPGKPAPIAVTSRKRRSANHFTIMPMITMMTNLASVHSLPPNAVMDGIRVHRFSTTSPPMPKVPPHKIPPPSGFDDAAHGPYSAFWRPAIQNEIDSLFHYRVWRLERIPPGALVLPCKMVFKVKPDGNDPPGISKFKCRYCG